MKRQRSHDDDLDGAFAGGERPGGGSWQRRDLLEADRTAAGAPQSHHRRPSSLYSKEISRKGLSAAPSSSSYDDDRGAMRRKRFDHDEELGGFDRRKGWSDRYRVGGGERLLSSPRGGGGGERIYRSESFSVLRSEFPKRFRSERDRSRREGSDGSSSSSWRKSSIWKESGAASASASLKDESKRHFTDADSARKWSRPTAPMEDWKGKARTRDASFGEQRSLKRPETVKAEKRSVERSHEESSNKKEMEEGELEQDPVATAEICTDDKALTLQSELSGKAKNLQSDSLSEINKVDMEGLSSNKKLVIHDEDETDSMGKMKPINYSVDTLIPITAQPKHDKNEMMKVIGEKKKEEAIAKVDENKEVERVEGKLCFDEQEVVIKVDNKHASPQSENNDASQKDDESEPLSSASYPLLAEKLQVHEISDRIPEGETQSMEKEGVGKEIEVEQAEHRDTDLEAEPDGASTAAGLFDLRKKVAEEDVCDGDTDIYATSKNKIIGQTSDGEILTLLTDKPEDNKDKGKSIAASISCADDFGQEVDATAGPSGRRGFEWIIKSDFRHQENSQSGGVYISKKNNGKLKVETLDLSLSLSGNSLDHPIKHSKTKPESSNLAKSTQSMPSSFQTSSDGLTTSISFTNSQTFVHNPSCSLTQHSGDNYEHSVGSRSMFQGMDQVSNDPIRQGQRSNDAKQNGTMPLLQKILLNGNSSHNLNGEHQSKSNGLLQQASLSRPLSLPHSHGYHHIKSEYSKDKRVLTRGGSSGSLIRSEQQEGEQLIFNGTGVTEKILSKIVSEPLHLNSRMLQDMTEQSVAYLKETICEILMDLDKSKQIQLLQQALQRRSDICMDTLTKCSRVLLEILVSIKTGLPDFIQRPKGISSSDLSDIFLNLKCHNLACRSMLPVEDCDCKVCTQRTGFCSACMCLVCSKFDNASNTCSWVGCDVCLHWCHTDCGLRESHIKNAGTGSNQRITGMQFHCFACDHHSEMFGFMKEVFRTCAKDWTMETLIKELQYVRRIFFASLDVRDRTLSNVAEQMLKKLENQSNYSDVVAYVMAFLSDSESNADNSLLVPSKEPIRFSYGESNVACSSKNVKWHSVPHEKVQLLENSGIITDNDYKQVSRTARESETQINIEAKPIVDGLESVVKFKQAEAKMYQERADAARKEAEGLKCIAAAKSVQIEEDFVNRIGKLRLNEAKERRKEKFEELQVIERSNHDYFSMKNRMEADIKDLLLKMESTRRNLNT